MSTDLIVGQVYEIDAYIKVNLGNGPIPEKFYAKLIGFNSEGDPVFERGKDYFSCNEIGAKITALSV